MSRGRIELLRSFYSELSIDSIAAGEFELLAPDFEYDVAQPAPDFGVMHGVDGFTKVMLAFLAPFEGWRVEPREFIERNSDRVIVRAVDIARMSGSDSEVHNEFWHAWTFREDVAIRLAVFTERALALEDADLS